MKRSLNYHASIRIISKYEYCTMFGHEACQISSFENAIDEII